MNTTAPKTCAKCGKPILEGSPRGLCPLCLISAVAKSDEPPPPESSAPELEDLRRSFPHLEILEPLGAGGMGRVYKTRQPHLDRLVALKVLPPAYANDPEWVERFTREARALARLNHPNIVQVYDFGETAPDENGRRFPFLIMEFVDGVNLRQALRTGALTAREALSIVPSICGALQYAHDQGVLHRDIKPENILLDTFGRVKIADFGLAKLRGDGAPNLTLTATGARLGTTAYMAPEQIEKPHEVDHRADIYSLGVVFYELLTGELPLGRFAAPSEMVGTDPRLDTIVFRTLEKERERRFQTATAMQSEVETVANSPAPEPSDTTPVVSRGPVPPRAPVALIIALLLLPALLVAIGFAVPMLGRRGVGGVSFAEVIILLPMALLFYAGVVAGLTWLFRRLRRAGLSGVAASAIVGLLMVFLPATGCVPMLLVPYLALRSSPQGSRFSTPAADVVTAKSAPFIARLPEGTVELVAVSHHPSSGEPWWKMDGSPATEGPFHNKGGSANAQMGQRGYEFVFRIKNLPATATLTTWQISNAFGWATGNTPELTSAPGVPLAGYQAIAATLPATLRATDIRIGFGFGEWETVFGAGTSGPGGTNPFHDGVRWELGWSVPLETKDGLTVTNWNVPRNPDWETRVVAVKADGTEVTTGDRDSANNQTTWRFANLPLAQVKDFRFQVRRVQWIEFRGVALAPSAHARHENLTAAPPLEEEAISLARERVVSTQRKFEAGVASPLEVAAAERDFAIAQARGDATKIAEIRVRFSEQQVEMLRQQHQVGVASTDDVHAAETALNSARRELEDARKTVKPLP